MHQQDAVEAERIDEAGSASEGDGPDRSINIIIEPQEQEDDNVKLSEEFDNERIQNTINKIALKQEADQLRCSILDDRMDTCEEELQPDPYPVGQGANSMFH